MENINSQASFSSQDKGSNIFLKMKSFLMTHKWFILILAVILILAILIIVYFTSKKSGVNVSKNPPLNDTFSQSRTNTKIKIGGQEVTFIDLQKRPDGYYTYVYDYNAQCVTENGQKTCPFNGVDMFPTTNTWAALAHFAAYEISNNKMYLDRSIEDLAKLNEFCSKDRTQCLWVLVQPSIIYEKTKNAQVLEFLKAQTPALKASAISSDNLMLAAIQVREMFMIGEILNDSSLISKAQNSLADLSKSLTSQPNQYQGSGKQFSMNSCWVALANLYSPSANYKDIKAFLDNGEIIKNFQYYNNPIDIQPCIEAYFVIANKGSDNSSKETAIALQTAANNAFFDGAGAMKKVYGNGGYLFNKIGTQTKTPGFQVLTDVSYASYLESLSIK